MSQPERKRGRTMSEGRREKRKGTCDRERRIVEEGGEEEKSGICQLENNKRRS